jgi:hypothetical protein
MRIMQVSFETDVPSEPWALRGTEWPWEPRVRQAVGW